jgi:hypothetical protein
MKRVGLAIILGTSLGMLISLGYVVLLVLGIL